MNDTIIGGAVAAVIGALAYVVVGLWQERRREKAQRLQIVDALIVETQENLAIYETVVNTEIWWFALYRLEAYNSYKGQLFFLPKQVQTKLIAAAMGMDSFNVLIRGYRSKEAFKRNPDNVTMQPVPELIEELEFVRKQLLNWKEKHTGFLGFFRR
jgi:hypothetical protein